MKEDEGQDPLRGYRAKRRQKYWHRYRQRFKAQV